VFATELAEALKMRATKVVSALAELDMYPASSSGMETCGKIFYARANEAEGWLVSLGAKSPSTDRE